MDKRYDPYPEREYIAPEESVIVKPEPMTPKIPKWIKRPILLYLILGAYLSYSTGDFFMANKLRKRGMSKSEIEERIDDKCSNMGDLAKFVMDDFSRPGRELAYLIRGDGEQEK